MTIERLIDLMALQRVLKGCCIAALVLLALVGLGPQNWQPRSGLGWEVDHFIGYFVLTLLFCLAWPRPLVVAGALIVFAAVLEALQALTPDRWSNIWAVVYSACGIVVAALIVEVFVRVRRRFQSRQAQEPSL
jgi:VanZ family protein